MISSNELFGHEKSVAEYIMEAIEKKEQEVEAIKYMTPKEKEFAIFKIFYNSNDKEKQKLLYELFKKNILMLHKITSIRKMAEEAEYYMQIAWFNRHDACIKIIYAYKKLLNKMSILAKELNMNNSLELSILYSYLLWNGYLSKTHKHEYKENEDNIFLGMQFTDISNGIGVCRNYSEMLKDFLNYSGFNSIILSNYFDEEKVINKMLKSRSQKSNHAFNLIDDKGLYIYDSTNQALYNLTRQNSVLLAKGEYKSKAILRLYRSYGLCSSKHDEDLLDRLFYEQDFISPYDKSDLISIRDVSIELLTSNVSLLEDFYSDAKPNIISISDETKKILIRKKNK